MLELKRTLPQTRKESDALEQWQPGKRKSQRWDSSNGADVRNRRVRCRQQIICSPVGYK